jgi:Fe-S oxidoreductase
VEQCPVQISYVDKIVEMRRHEMMVKNAFPADLQKAFRGMETNGNPWNLPAMDRGNWATGLDAEGVQVRFLADHPDAEVVFDDAASPWYTLCEVRSPDRRGLLHMITVGLAAAGASVHSARLVTLDGQAVDRFELTDADGRKLTRDAKVAVRAALVDGVMPTRGRRAKRRAAAALAALA